MNRGPGYCFNAEVGQWSKINPTRGLSFFSLSHEAGMEWELCKEYMSVCCRTHMTLTALDFSDDRARTPIGCSQHPSNHVNILVIFGVWSGLVLAKCTRMLQWYFPGTGVNRITRIYRTSIRPQRSITLLSRDCFMEHNYYWLQLKFAF